MIRSDYLCKRTITLGYILYFCVFVLGVTLVFGASANISEGCQSFNTFENNVTDYTNVMELQGRNYIHFKVNTCSTMSTVPNIEKRKHDNKAYVGFYSDDGTYIKMEIVFGWKFSLIRKRESSASTWINVTTISDVGILNCGDFFEFWISYDDGMFKVRQGIDLGSDTIMEYNDTSLDLGVIRVAFKTLYPGEWCFFDTDNGTQTSSTVDNIVELTPPPSTRNTNKPIIMNTTPSYLDYGTHTAEQTSATMDNNVELTPTLPQSTNKPIKSKMTPSYGPVSGGTEVNINGSFPDSITKLWLGSKFEYQLNITDMKSGNISAVTPPYTRDIEPNVTGVVLNVIIQLDNNVTTVTDVAFTYKPDPQVVNIYPRKMTKSGGLTVTVEGSNLDSVAAPMLTVTVIQRSDQNQRTTYYSRPCEAESSKQLLCVTPKINTKRKRHTADNRHRRQSNDEELDFVLGLQFDGADNYEDLTDNLPHLAHIEVHQDPSFSPGQMFSFDPEFAGAIGIKGENIDAGVVVADYNVRIGKGFCTNIGITSDKLYCNPPLTLDEVADGNSINTTRAHNEVDITVRVGTNLVYTVGYIVYDIEETISLYTIFVPVVAALGALLVVFVIILIVCCCRKARAKKDSDKTLAPSAQDLNTLEPSRNDNYYTDETQPKNQYYMVVNQGANGQ